MGSKRKNRFGETIEFSEILADVVYVSKLDYVAINTKLYVGHNVPSEKSVKKHILDKPYFPSAYRKMVFERKTGSGIIIGQTKRVEGVYAPGYYDIVSGDGEPPYLDPRRVYTFWVVATSMNKKVLVPK